MSDEEENRRILHEEYKRMFREESRRRAREAAQSSSSPVGAQSSSSPVGAQSSSSPVGAQFTAAYGSREPFGSPIPPRDSATFTPTYGSREPFGSPQPPFRTSPQRSGRRSRGSVTRPEQSRGPETTVEDLTAQLSSWLSMMESGSKEMGGPSGSGMSSQQQTEPSVRPKVRKPQEPPLYRNTIPDTEIVRKFRNPETGRPDFSQYTRSEPLPDDPRERAFQLANTSRGQIEHQRSYERARDSRKRGYLAHARKYEREYDEENKIERFRPRIDMDDRSTTSQPSLEPATSEDFLYRISPRFNKPIDLMDYRPPASSIGPVGRQSYGPTPRRAVSLPDLRQLSDDNFPTNQEVFDERYHRLPKKHQKYYKEFRNAISWEANKPARRRLVKRPSQMGISAMDKKALGRISWERHTFNKPFADRNMADTFREEKKKYVGHRAVLPSSIKDKDWGITPIPETSDEEDSESED